MKKIFRYITVWTAISIMLIFNCVGVYASEYHDLRDSEIELFLPDSWECEEVDKSDSVGMSYEWIAEAYDNKLKATLGMELYYMSDALEELESFYIYEDEEAAVEYYEKYGKTAVETLYEEAFDAVTLNIGQVTFFDGDYDGFLVVPVSYIDGGNDSYEEIVYLTCETVYGYDERTLVHKMLVFYDYNGVAVTGDDLDVIEEIANDFYDYGYADGDYTDDGSDNDSEVVEVLIGVLGTIVSIIAAITAAVVAIRKKITDNKNTKNKNTKNRFAKKKSHDHIGDIMKKNQIDRKDGKRSSSAEERYMEGLRTLRKSGLLTREEMIDMLERHERNRNYKRRN